MRAVGNNRIVLSEGDGHADIEEGHFVNVPTGATAKGWQFEVVVGIGGGESGEGLELLSGE